jgi:hypothetical protein
LSPDVAATQVGTVVDQLQMSVPHAVPLLVQSTSFVHAARAVAAQESEAVTERASTKAEANRFIGASSPSVVAQHYAVRTVV